MLKPIKTEEDYDNALAHIYDLMQTDVTDGSAIADELEILSILVKEFELVHYPISYPNSIDAIKFSNGTNEPN